MGSWWGRAQLAKAARLLLNFRGERQLTFYRTAFELLHHVTPVIAIDFNGMRFFVSTTDATGSWFFAMRESFDERHLAKAVTLARKVYPDAGAAGRTLIDVGANIGTTSITAVMRYGFKRSLAIEPEPSNLYFLRLNAVANGVEDRVHIVPVAAGEQDGYVQMELSPENSADHRVRLGPPTPGLFGEDGWVTRTIEAKTLDGILTAEGVEPEEIGLVWMDVQGFEAHVLAGARMVVDSPIPLVIEYWPYGLRRTGSLERLWQQLSDHYTGFLDIRRASVDEQPQPIDSLPDIEVGAPDGFTDLLLVK